MNKIKHRIYKTLLATLITFTVLFSACCQAAPTTTIIVPETPTSFSDVVEAITPSVVFISATGTFSSSTGSGVIMDPDGYILTNRHVVEGATTVHVTLQNRKTYNATNVWIDDLADLAVVKIAGSQPFAAAQFVEEDDPAKVGDWAVAVGHPLGLSPDEGGATVTAGIISNLDRSFTIDTTTYYDVIQTDAAINPGNSGGPLLNLEGKVIGINSAVSTEAQGVGYAINVSTAKPVYEGLASSTHTVVRPFIGVGLRDVEPLDVTNLGLTIWGGALITQVQEGFPAEQAGLQANDVITSINGAPIVSYASLIRELWPYDAGDTITIGFFRDDDPNRTAEVTLVARPSN
ncbi:MAG: PDZ domain-containing protein [Chloroflexi bacterium]|jgi:serine protease Do|nr:PDZ domain-containing protein [Chloroflexota bacterium]